jgi:hypothetical protein
VFLQCLTWFCDLMGYFFRHMKSEASTIRRGWRCRLPGTGLSGDSALHCTSIVSGFRIFKSDSMSQVWIYACLSFWLRLRFCSRPGGSEVSVKPVTGQSDSASPAFIRDSESLYAAALLLLNLFTSSGSQYKSHCQSCGCSVFGHYCLRKGLFFW